VPVPELSNPPDAAPATALGGVRVLDLSRVLAGPLCTMILGDLGAEVIKVERPGSGDDTRQWGPPWAQGEGGSRESAYYLCTNRNKRSLAADLKDAGDLRLVRELALGADVLVENFAPGTLGRLGLGYEELSAGNPRLVFCSITGYGSDGPDAGRPGYDFAVQARAGWMAVTGDPAGEPHKVGFALVDVLTGQNAAIAILAALHERERSGRGQRVEIALMDSAVAGLINVAQAALVTGREPVRYGNAHPTIVPYQAFAAADRPLVIAVGNDGQWRRLCAALDRHDLAADPRFATNPGRVENRGALIAFLEGILRTRAAAEWLEALERADVPCAPVQSVREALADPALRLRDGYWPMRGPTFGPVETVASPLRLQRTRPALRRPAPALAEHDAEIRDHGWEDRGEEGGKGREG
jgi:crotonobetainyl-CoA:carnitine CoA-transferase CaiB-like acyl-CoA transferase